MIPDPELRHLLQLGQEIQSAGNLIRKPSWVDLMHHISTKADDPNYSAMQVARDCASVLQLAERVGSAATIQQFEREFYDHPDLRDAYIDLIRLSQPDLVRDFRQEVLAIQPQDLAIIWPANKMPGRPGRRSHPGVPDQDDVHKYLHKPMATYKPVKQPVSAAQISDLRDFLYETRHPLDLIITPSAIQNSLFLGGVLSECTWVTGLRPGEWREARILLGEPSEQTLADGRITATLAQMPAVSPDDPNAFRKHMNAAIEGVLSQPGVWLKVKSLKTRNRAAKIPEHRMLGLGNLPVSTRVTIFALIVAARSTDKKRWGDLCRNAQRRTANATKHILPEYGGKFSFLQLRNDFADRGRAVLDDYELAYMMGHSSLKSQKNYGRPGRSTRSGSRKPDMAIYVPSAEVRKTRLAIEQHMAERKAAVKPPEPSNVPGLKPDTEGQG